MSVSIIAGALDLYAPKFNLDALGMPGEKLTIRIVVASKDGLKRLTLFGTGIRVKEMPRRCYHRRVEGHIR